MNGPFEGIDGIQVEIPRDLRIDGGEEGRKRVGHALGKAISDFHHFHYKPHAPKAQGNLFLGVFSTGQVWLDLLCSVLFIPFFVFGFWSLL